MDLFSFTCTKRYSKIPSSKLRPVWRPEFSLTSQSNFQERFNSFKNKLKANNYIKDPSPKRRVDINKHLQFENTRLRDMIINKPQHSDETRKRKGSPDNSANQISILFDNLERYLK